MLEFFQQNWVKIIELIISFISGICSGTYLEYKYKIIQRIYQKNRSKQLIKNSPSSSQKNAGNDLSDKSVNYNNSVINNFTTINIGTKKDLFKKHFIEPNKENQSFKLESSHYFIIEKIDLIHKKNGKTNYSFQSDLLEFLIIKKNKSNKCWYFSAAIHLAQCIQGLGPKVFFETFITLPYPTNNIFDDLKNKIIKIYHEELQAMRHTDKDCKLKERYLSLYDRETGKSELPETEMEKILDEFYNYLEEILKIGIIK